MTVLNVGGVIGSCLHFYSISFDRVREDMPFWFERVVPWAIFVPPYHIPSSLCHIYMKPYATYHVLLWWSGIIPCRIFCSINIVSLLSSLISWLPSGRHFVWNICHLVSCGWQCKTVDENCVRYTVFFESYCTFLYIEYYVRSSHSA